MNKILAAAIIAFLVTPAYAYDWDSDDSDDAKFRHRGTTGTQYQYDLSRPGDQIRYETDVSAQMRDEISVDPRRDLDRDLGQYGGGIRR